MAADAAGNQSSAPPRCLPASNRVRRAEKRILETVFGTRQATERSIDTDARLYNYLRRPPRPRAGRRCPARGAFTFTEERENIHQIWLLERRSLLRPRGGFSTRAPP